MYLPKQFAETDQANIRHLMKSHPLGSWTVWTGEQLVVNELPFLFDARQGERGILTGHVARANPIWKLIHKAQPSVVVFQGPQSYITPAWYPGKQTDGKVVPTWNYAVVHAHGSARVIEEPEWLLNHVTELTDSQEAGRELAWRVSDAPDDFIRTLLNGIVGIEITITKIEAKWKVSQNRSREDRQGVVCGLKLDGNSQSAAMAELVEDKIKSDKK